MTIADLFVNAAEKFPETVAVVSDRRRLTFRRLEERSRCLAGALLDLGLRSGDPVGLLFYNSIVMVEAYLAVIRAGLVAVPINFRLTAREMAPVATDSGAKVLFHGPEFDRVVGEMLPEAPQLKRLVRPDAPTGGTALDYERFLAAGSNQTRLPNLTGDQVCQIMYTSGTTGRPKGAVISHRSVVWNLLNTIHGREDRAGQRSIIVGPLYHTAALNNHLSIQLALGGTAVLIRKFDPEGLLAVIERERATTISGPPAMFNLLLRHPRAKDYDVSSITKCTAGADKLAMETKRRLMEFFPNIKGIYDVYGCTEAAPCITILNAADSLRKDFSVGPALPFLQAKVIDDQGRDLPPGQVGELVCKGPNVMTGYHNDPIGTAEAIRDGWLHTGDLARMDEEGFFYIVDRKKDMIVSGGENIYPRELEEVLYTHPEIVEAAVIGRPDGIWGQRVVAVVVRRPGDRLNEEDVIDFCKARLAGYKKPRQVVFLEELPRNASGKVMKKDLQAAWQEDPAR